MDSLKAPTFAANCDEQNSVCNRSVLESIAEHIPVTILLLFLMGSIWIVTLKTSWSVTLKTSIQSSLDNVDIDDPLGNTFSTGGRESLRSHLSCFSESGKWVYDPRPRRLPWNYVGDPYVSTCEFRPGYIFGDMADDVSMREGEAQGNWSVREELKWVWQTNKSCPWQSIKRDDFCKKIGAKGQLMVVGDSLNHEIIWSLVNALINNGSQYKHLSPQDRNIYGPYQMCHDIVDNGKGFMVSFVRNDRLSPVLNAAMDRLNNFYEFPWVNLLKDYDIKLLLLNRGAHYEDDEIYSNALRTIFTILRFQYPHIQVIYRNTQPGHVNCMNFTHPLSNPQTDFPPSNWHWEDFNRQNLLAKQIVEEFDYIYMDVYTMLSLRPDGHVDQKDCLHYCIPGPLHVVVEYLYNILLLL